jgi:predicted methyltransferase
MHEALGLHYEPNILMKSEIVLSYMHMAPLLRAREEGSKAVQISLDLGLTTSEVELEPERVVFPRTSGSPGRWLAWERIQEIAQTESVCFLVTNNEAEKIQRFSELLNRFYSLMPTARAPTLLVSGIPMHRIKGIDPHQDTLRKIRTLAPCAGRVLDTCTGLGYTAIEAAKTAEQIVTVELDPTVLEVARLNPWSRQLFGHPRIQQTIADVFEAIQTFEDGAFSRIVHDPPTLSLAGELYSGEFYRQSYRVLGRKGRMFHYIGDPDSRSGRNATRGVVRRLQEAGFSRVIRKPAAFGVVAYKG